MHAPIRYLRLRPHHILCLRFLDRGMMSDRGEGFLLAYRELMAMLSPYTETMIEVACGVDVLCHQCSHCGEGRCASPLGDEEQVRRWDQKVLEGLGLHYGYRLSSGGLTGLIQQRAPLDFCRGRCPWKSICTVSKAHP